MHACKLIEYILTWIITSFCMVGIILLFHVKDVIIVPWAGPLILVMSVIGGGVVSEIMRRDNIRDVM